MKKVNIKINNKEISCDCDKTIMQVAKENGFFIPGLCNHPDFKAKATCRVCVVEIKGYKSLMTSCSTLVKDGMEISTNSDRVKKARNLNLELIFAEHIEKCPDCVWRVNCKLLNLVERYKLEINRFPERKKNRKTYKMANAVELDSSQCIDCRNCIDACVLQKIDYLKIKGKGFKQEIVPIKNSGLSLKKGEKVDCIYCGQCAVHCPVGAAQEQTHWQEVEKVLKNKKKIVVAQFAPAVRVSIGEEFGVKHGKIMTGQMVKALKKIGFDYVFDVNFAADVTTMVEAGELLERLGDKKSVLPMMTSCCPAWVKFIEYYHPELIPNLTTSRSPQIHLGGIIKTYWAKKIKINPKNIVVVSIMPCTAKKFESSRNELNIGGLKPVDYVLTTREFAWMIKKNNINFAKLKKEEADSPLGKHSGAAAIYGGSGGVMESALRTAVSIINKNSKSKIVKNRLEFKNVRGLKNIKEAEINVNGIKLRVAVVNGIGNIEPIIKNLDKYDYIEVMACPGGCIGGGGQPVPTTKAIRKKRIEALYELDKNSKIRKAHENKDVMEVLQWIEKAKLNHKILHTKYKKRK